MDVFQGEYNLFKRKVEKDLLPFAEKNNISFIPYFPLLSGFLAGKYDRNTIFNDGRAKNPLFQGDTFINILEEVEQVREFANSKGVDMADIVLA